jgi:hypothetical protein
VSKLDVIITDPLTGADMANAFIEHLVGDKIAERIRSVVELSAKGVGDDEWAAYHGLV